jgi:hypothetical protein
MNLTFRDIIEEVTVLMEGFEANYTVEGYLASNAGTGNTLTVTTGNTTDVPRVGVWQIEDELILVTNVTVTSAPSTTVFATIVCQRGFRGTPVSNHSTNTIIQWNPLIPRHWIKRAINDTIVAFYPRIPGIETFDFTYQGGIDTYDIPDEAVHVHSVFFKAPGREGWIPSRRWSFNSVGSPGSITGKALTLFEAMPGQTVRVVYFKPATAMTNENNPFIGHTGLPMCAKDAVVYGACHKLASFIDTKRFANNTADQRLLANESPANQGQNLSRYYLALYEKAVTETEAKIQDLYPAVKHYTY